MSVLTVSRIVFKEAVRDRILNLIWLFGLVLLGLSLFLGDLSAGNELKVVKDFGLGTINLLLILVAVMVGSSAIFREIDKRTIYVVLAKPVSRWQFLVGKWLGLMAVLAVLAIAMGVGYCGLMWLITRHLEMAVAPTIAFMFIEAGVVAALALLFSCITSPTLSMIYVLGVFLVGHNTDTIRHFGERGEAPKYIQAVGRTIYYLLPNLGALNIKNQVVYGHGITLAAGSWAMAYGLMVMVVLLALAALAFSKREI